MRMGSALGAGGAFAYARREVARAMSGEGAPDPARLPPGATPAHLAAGYELATPSDMTVTGVARWVQVRARRDGERAAAAAPRAGA